MDVIKDPEVDVVVLATLLVVKDEIMELTGDEGLVLVLMKDEPVEVDDKAVVLMLVRVEVDMKEEPAELVEIEEPGEVLPIDEPLGEETGTDEFAAPVELGVEAKDDPVGVVERDTIELPLGREESVGFEVVIELPVPLANEEDGLLVLPMEDPTGEDANDEPVVLVEDNTGLETGLVIEEPIGEDAKDEAVVLVEDDLRLDTGLFIEEPTGEDGKDEAVAPVEDDCGLGTGFVMAELVRVDIKDDPFRPPLDDVELEPGFVIEDPAGADVVDESEGPELIEGDDATEVTEDPLEDDEVAGLEAAGDEAVVDPDVEETLMGWLGLVVDMVVSRVVVSFGQPHGAWTGPQYIALKERTALALSKPGAISFEYSPMACNCLKCRARRPNRFPPASWQRE
ncbi:hypothetical protein KC332_g593 [Hortaea werneckii]|nr:hypothetical protein KC358_g7481 [Hortaea werneckii]KAI6843567.1 hypothetical protein KC350_g4889 [Hortaea werneckii]KAI6929263.1 hypothetical protein KC348_g7896 [Hortaea werneckii]KAI6931204.1 hypothetical protein KC341_g9755 [Hortaea werneckii]KAI6969556.1 hypothetical protein KC321_g7824 [Hortaea werneckii]